MTETNFTPGPWRVEGGTTVVWGACSPEDLSNYGMGYPVTDCRITPFSNSSWCQGPEYEEGYANAHLIAAAPDLYEALETMMNEYSEVIREYKGVNVGSCGDVAYDVAGVALAKARGEV